MRLLLMVAFLAATSPAFGDFGGMPELEDVPVGRLIENLE